MELWRANGSRFALPVYAQGQGGGGSPWEDGKRRETYCQQAFTERMPRGPCPCSQSLGVGGLTLGPSGRRAAGKKKDFRPAISSLLVYQAVLAVNFLTWLFWSLEGDFWKSHDCKTNIYSGLSSIRPLTSPRSGMRQLFSLAAWVHGALAFSFNFQQPVGAGVWNVFSRSISLARWANADRTRDFALLLNSTQRFARNTPNGTFEPNRE